jgi:hypothetical protein
MKDIFWNIRGLNQPGRNLSLGQLIRYNNLDFVGIHETKKEEFLPSFLKNLTTPMNYIWHYLPTKRTAGGILLGIKEKGLVISNVSILKISFSCMILDKKRNFSWKLVVMYGSPFDDGKAQFIDELHSVLAVWQGPMVIGGYFILSRFVTDKSNGRINQKYVDYFNDWVNKWGLIEISPSNRRFTWENNQKK